MDFINLNESVKTAIRISQSIAREYYNAKYSAAHLLKALLHKEVGLRDFIRIMDIDLGYFEEWAEMRIDDFPKAGVIADIQPDDKIPAVIEEALKKQGIELEIEEDTRRMLSGKGFTPKYGARQIAGTIRTYLRRPISRMIIGNKLTHGNKIVVNIDKNGEIVWEIK